MAVNLDTIPQAVETLVRMGARRVILFGSAAESSETANDIDIGVEGIPLNCILEANAAPMDILRQPFDLLACEENPALFEIISRYGKMLYG